MANALDIYDRCLGEKPFEVAYRMVLGNTEVFITRHQHCRFAAQSCNVALFESFPNKGQKASFMDVYFPLDIHESVLHGCLVEN